MKIITLITASSTLFLTSCVGNNEEKSAQNTMATDSMQKPLADELNKRKANFEKSAPEEKQRIYADGLKATQDSKVVSNALQVGDTAIDFILPNAAGEKVRLFDALKKGPVILMWYRGGWCPYCNLTLHHMQEALPEFKKYGANLMAVSPELPDSSISTKEKHDLKFEVLSDVGNEVARTYKVVFKLTEDVAKKYEGGFGLSKYNGDNSAELPLAATFIIGQDGVIKYTFLDADYRNRAEPHDLIDFLKAM